MIKIEFVKHGECSESLIRKICEFKNLNWQHPIESHLSWIEKNLKSEDLHMLLYDDDKLLAYLNLVDTMIDFDKRTQPIFGIGNVCVAPEYKGQGYGHLIMDVVMFYCSKNKRLGVLLCQDKNIGFYRNCNWKVFEGIIKDTNGEILKSNLFTTQTVSSEFIGLLRNF